MDQNKINHQLIARYLAGKCSPKEEKHIEKWAQQNAENSKQIKELKHIWNVSGKNLNLLKESLNAGESWSSLKQRLVEEQEFTKPNISSRSVKSATSIHSTAQKLMRVAAIFLVAGLIGFLSYQNFYQPQPETKEQVLREISTDRGQRVNLTLTDNTKVLLNADSKIKIQTNFVGDMREVFLEGEAYFDVAENPDKPFLIYSSESLIRVLGTSFSVRSYPEDRGVFVAVEKGRVSFEVENSSSPQKKILTQGQLGRYDVSTQTIEAEEPEDLRPYLSWMKGYLQFDETTMGDVAIELERRYDINITFKDEDIKEMKVTAYLKSRSIRNVLDVIANSLDIGYQLKEEQVTFFTENE